MDKLIRTQSNNGKDKLSTILIILLLILRFPLLFAGAFGIIDTSFVVPIFLCGTYLGTGLFICLNRTRLEQYNFSFGAMVLFFIAPVAALLDDRSDPTIWFRLILAIGFVFFILRKKDTRLVEIPKKNVFLNIIFTLILCIVVPLLFGAIRGFSSYGSNNNTLSVKYIIDLFCFQLAYAAVSEEPLFRGFLTGYLRKRGMKELTICIMIALSFWAGHIYYVGTGLNFWIVHPIAAFLLSFIVMKTKSVSYSMVFHSCLNASGDILQFIKL